MNKSNLSRVLMAAIATAMVSIAAPAFADGSPEELQRFVQMCDINKDGMISKAEFMKRAEDMLAKMPATKDNMVDSKKSARIHHGIAKKRWQFGLHDLKSRLDEKNGNDLRKIRRQQGRHAQQNAVRGIFDGTVQEQWLAASKTFDAAETLAKAVLYEQLCSKRHALAGVFIFIAQANR